MTAQGADGDKGRHPVERPSRAARRLRWLLAAPVIVLLLGALALSSMPWWLSPAWVRTQVVSALTDDLGIQTEIGGLDYHPLTGLALTDVLIRAPAGFTRDMLKADRIEVRYSLWPLLTGEAVVRKVVIKNAHVVYEQNGPDNSLDALLAQIDRALGPSVSTATASQAKAPSSLTPIGVRVHDIEVGPLTLEVAGDGPTATLSQVWLRAEGRLGTDTLTASAAVSIEPEAGQPNFAFQSGATVGEMTARARVPIQAEADTSAGYVPGATAVSADIGLTGLVERPDGPLPPVDLSARLRAAVDPPGGTATLSRLRVALDGRALVDARAAATGLWRMVVGAHESGPAAEVGRALGLTSDPTPDHIEAEVAVMSLPFDELEPLLVSLIPSLVSVDGRAEARSLRVAGSLGALLDGRPPELTGAIRAEGVACRWPGTLMLERLDGELTARRSAQTGPPTPSYTAQGRFRLQRLAVAGQKVGEGTLTLAAAVDQLDAATGATSATVTVDVTDLVTPPLSASRADASVYLQGRDPLVPARRPTAPVSVRAVVDADNFRIGTVLSSAHARVSASVDADRIVDAARKPWSVSVGADVRSFKVPGFRTREGQVKISGTTGDFRRSGFSADLDLTGAFLRPASSGATAYRVTIGGRAGASDVRQRRADGFSSPLTLPKRAYVDLEARARGARYQGLATPLRVAVAGDLDFETGLLRVASGRIGVAHGARLNITGRLRRLFRGRLAGRLRARLNIPDLEGLWARVPVAFRGGFDDLETSGGLRASLSVGGRWPSPWPDRIDWSRPPAQGRLRVRSDDASFSSETLALDVRAMTATVTAQVSPGVALLTPNIRVGSARYADVASVESLRLDGVAGLEAGMWRAVTLARAGRIATEVDGQKLSDTASIDVDARYVPGGELSIGRLDARFPSAGIVFGTTGRLRRGPQAELVPELTVDAQVDLGPLSVLVPTLRNGGGRLSAHLDVQPGPSDTYKVVGRTQLDRFSWTGPRWSIKGATGAAPIVQTVHLPAPQDRGPVAFGWLGDDLEHRLATFVARLADLQVVVDPSVDILAIAPRTADHYALSPYRRAVDAELVATELRFGDTPLTELRAEARLEEGVLRIDRFQAGLWEGDLLFDVALQVTPELDVKTRLRGTMTDLNLDIPYARAKGIAPVTAPDEKAEYLASGVMDFELALNERALEGQIDVVRLSRPLVDRFFGALDPSGESSAARALGYSEIAAVRPVSAKLWIAQNLLNVQFEWERVLGFDDWAPWWLVVDTVLLAPRVVSAWILGGAWVIPTVNNSVKRASVFNFLDPYIGPTLNNTSALLAGFQTRVVSSDELATRPSSPAE